MYLGVHVVCVILIVNPGKDRFCLDSRKVNEVTKKDAYPIPSLEGLVAVVLALKKLRMYIDGHLFKIITDHTSLKWL